MIRLFLQKFGSKLGKIIKDYKALCQGQKHKGMRLVFVIIVGTMALKAGASIIAFTKVPLPDISGLFCKLLASRVFGAV